MSEEEHSVALQAALTRNASVIPSLEAHVSTIGRLLREPGSAIPTGSNIPSSADFLDAPQHRQWLIEEQEACSSALAVLHTRPPFLGMLSVKMLSIVGLRSESMRRRLSSMFTCCLAPQAAFPDSMFLTLWIHGNENTGDVQCGPPKYHTCYCALHNLVLCQLLGDICRVQSMCYDPCHRTCPVLPIAMLVFILYLV
jgi:hypothetical protein